MKKSRLTILLLFICCLITSSFGQTLSFPGAEGFGKYTSGGRGGDVLFVENLNDSGKGSLRWAVEKSGKRIIIFNVSGTIKLKSPLIISKDNLTIAGQTAPGDGICIRDFPTIITADNIIIRFLRFRLGDVYRLSEDALMSIRNQNIVVDHCSMSWGIDEVASFYGNRNSTIQWCLLSESLHSSYHHKGDHGYGGIWGGRKTTFHHNIIAHNSSRTPRFNGSRYHKVPEDEIVDFRNNVIYNWGFNGAYGGEAGSHNIVANYYKAGPATKVKNRIIEPWDSKSRWYITDNYVHGFPEISKNNWAGGVHGKHQEIIRVKFPFPVEDIKTEDAKTAYKNVLLRAGAYLPQRDTIDKRIVFEIEKGIAHYGGKYGKKLGIIDSQNDVGGWPELVSIVTPLDSDKDGMPDQFELDHGFDPNTHDSKADSDNDGYTNIEEYLNDLVETKLK